MFVARTFQYRIPLDRRHKLSLYRIATRTSLLSSIMNSRKRESDTTVVVASNNSTSFSPDEKAKPRLKVRVQRFHGVAKWTWNAGSEDEVCGICQSAYEGVAPGVKYPGDECPVVYGKCGHAYVVFCKSTFSASIGSAVPFLTFTFFCSFLSVSCKSFHLVCVATWLNSSRQTCPMCRYVVGRAREGGMYLLWFSPNRK